MTEQPSALPQRERDRCSPAAGPREIEVANLLAGEREVLLRHNGELYRLRLTMNNKLILTK